MRGRGDLPAAGPVGYSDTVRRQIRVPGIVAAVLLLVCHGGGS